METQIELLGTLSYVDGRLDELHEEYGDLPEKVKVKEIKSHDMKELVQETEGILKDIKNFCSTSKKTLIELKTKEEKFAKQQFKVRNNKEFDAITKEISHLRSEHTRLTDKLRTEGIKEENLLRILEDQKVNYNEAEDEAHEAREELRTLASDQNEEVKDLYDKRKFIADKIDESKYHEYERIRKFHVDPSVGIIKNSCAGCFSAVPPQKIVEIRNDLEKMFFCENCGRILYPDDLLIDDDYIDKIKVKVKAKTKAKTKTKAKAKA